MWDLAKGKTVNHFLAIKLGRESHFTFSHKEIAQWVSDCTSSHVRVTPFTEKGALWVYDTITSRVINSEIT